MRIPRDIDISFPNQSLHTTPSSEVCSLFAVVIARVRVLLSTSDYLGFGEEDLSVKCRLIDRED